MANTKSAKKATRQTDTPHRRQQGAADPPQELRAQGRGGDRLRQQDGGGGRAEGSGAHHRAGGAEGRRPSQDRFAQSLAARQARRGDGSALTKKPQLLPPATAASCSRSSPMSFQRRFQPLVTSPRGRCAWRVFGLPAKRIRVALRSRVIVRVILRAIDASMNQACRQRLADESGLRQQGYSGAVGGGSLDRRDGHVYSPIIRTRRSPPLQLSNLGLAIAGRGFYCLRCKEGGKLVERSSIICGWPGFARLLATTVVSHQICSYVVSCFRERAFP